MAEIIKMPLMSDTMTEGIISVWHKNIGDTVQSGELLADIETDKATMEFNSPEDGILLYRADNTLPIAIGAILAIIGKASEDISALLIGGHHATPTAAVAATENSNKAVVDLNPPVKELAKNIATSQTVAPATEVFVPPPTITAPLTTDGGRLKASPLAKSMATASGIDLRALKGSGDDGRIVKRDIEFYLSQQQPVAPVPAKESVVVAPVAEPVVTPPPTVEPAKLPVAPTPLAVGNHEDVRVSQMRKTIARRLAESKFTAPHFYLKMEVTMDNLIAYRQQLNTLSTTKISFNDLIVKACAMALRSHAPIRSSWLGDVIRVNKDINIGVAVAVEEGLLVPVLRHADQMSLMQIATTTRELAQQAKDRKLAPADMQGNTFTISNLGMFDIDEFTAIINPPDSCILAVGKINEVPAVVNGEIKIVNRLKLTLSCDHRVVDGATGAKFLQTLKSLLEEPLRLML